MVKKANINSKSKTVKFNNNEEKQDIKQDIQEELKEETKLVGGLKNVDDADEVDDDDYSTDQGDEEEVEKEINSIQTNNHLSRSDLKEALSREGFKFNDYFELIRNSSSKSLCQLT